MERKGLKRTSGPSINVEVDQITIDKLMIKVIVLVI